VRACGTRPRSWSIDGFHWREWWRYQLTLATLDRLAVNELLLTGAPALLLVRDEKASPLPGTVRLTSLKGSATMGRGAGSADARGSELAGE
jgi:hypothetical protein